MRLTTTILSLVLSQFICVHAQEQDTIKSKYQFESVIDLPTTSVKDQHRSGTCWSFSAISFIESEVLRMGGDTLDLSEMFVVRNCYSKKAERYVRMHGEINFSGGGAFGDLFYVLNHDGMIPNDVYTGLNYGEDGHVHGELDHILKSYVKAVVDNKSKHLSTAWQLGYVGILDSYFGDISESFSYKNKTYSPKTFADEVLKVKPDNYISITSFTHQSMYSSFMLEIPDNWLWHTSYNVKMDELLATIHNALEEGYTVAWGGDVSEKGFSHKNGLAILPVMDTKEMADSERGKWEKFDKLSASEKKKLFESPYAEIVPTQEMRQREFDNYLTTDDHGMHIVGTLKDQNGKVYFKVKNSWNTDNKYDGYLYMSEAYVALKTMNIVLHKDAVPKEILKKLALK